MCAQIQNKLRYLLAKKICLHGRVINNTGMTPHLSICRSLPLAMLPCLLACLFTISLQMASAQDAERWEKDIAAFEAADRKNPPPGNGVLFIGSSSIRNWKSLAADFPGLKVLNRGFGGSKIQDSIHFFDRIVKPYEPSVIVFYAGDNDINGGHTPKQVYENFKIFAGLVETHLPATRLVFIAIKPSLKRWNLASEMRKANTKIRHYAWFHRRVNYADIWKQMLGNDGKPRHELFVKDGLHLTEEGYRIWTQVVAQKL